MPVVELSGGKQTATIRYGWGVLHELSSALTKAIPTSVLAARLKGAKDVDPAKLIDSISAEELLPLLTGQMESQKGMIERVLIQVKGENGTVLWSKADGKVSVSDFLDYELEPDLGTVIAKHMAEAVKSRSEEVNRPNEELS